MDNSGTSRGGWSPYHGGLGESRPAHLEVGDNGEAIDSRVAASVVSVGALCGLRRQSPGSAGRSQSFWVSEFARLADGRRVILHEDRGLTIGLGQGVDIRDGLTREVLTHNVLNVVLPDGDSKEPHPWTWLAELARIRGLNASAESLSALPYEVVFTEEATEWVALPHAGHERGA